ncbi:family 43 glycosylhydrolase [Flavobacteriaceae bacterium M23B6Z8]
MYRAVYFIIFMLFFFLIDYINAQDLFNNNLLPRMDSEGEIVDAHDGRIIQFGDTFYWYGTAYGNTNGYTTANTYQCYSSTDLKTWKKEGRLLPEQPEGVYYRPHVIYNRKTKKYVLWYNWYPKLWEGRFGVAISDTPEGPYKIVNDHVKMANSDKGLGDFGLFVDDDGTGYISYNTIQNHQVSIEKLSSDYLSSTLENGGVISEHMEAGSMFKKDGKYYLLTDYTCCFCNYGSGARVYISNHPQKGYQLTGNINRYPGKRSYLLEGPQETPQQYEILQKEKENFQSIEVLLEKPQVLSGFDLRIFTGNRKGNCGDVTNPRVHPEIGIPDFEFFKYEYGTWKILPAKITVGNKTALSQNISIEFANSIGNRFKISPKNEFPFEAVYISELSLKSTLEHENRQVYVTGESIPRKPIIPAQQTYVMKLNTADGIKFIWMGDLWGSASDNIKGHDYQYWSAPLQFNEDGTIEPMKWSDGWNFDR